MEYKKPPLSLNEQCDLLISRGLDVPKREEVVNILKNISYYRLSAYFLPLQKERDKFNPQTKIKNIINLYEFDRRLRLIFLDTLEFIEVSLRTNITYFLSHKYGPFGYLNKENFSKNFEHKIWLEKVCESIKRSRELFVTHFFDKYKKHSNPPVWMMTEVISLGQLSKLFRGLNKSDRQCISKENYKFPSDFIDSWLHCLTYIRNLCAHHSRLWNRKLAVAPKIPKHKEKWDIGEKKIFNILMIFKYMIVK